MPSDPFMSFMLFMSFQFRLLGKFAPQSGSCQADEDAALTGLTVRATLGPSRPIARWPRHPFPEHRADGDAIRSAGH